MNSYIAHDLKNDLILSIDDEKYIKKVSEIGSVIVPSLIDMMMDKSNDSKVRQVAGKALGLIKDRRAIKPLISLLIDDERHGVFKPTCADSLGQIGGKEVINLLEC